MKVININSTYLNMSLILARVELAPSNVSHVQQLNQ